jgi:hypothetical protein
LAESRGARLLHDEAWARLDDAWVGYSATLAEVHATQDRSIDAIDAMLEANRAVRALSDEPQ